MRGIPTRLTIDFLKKARGTLRAESTCSVPDVPDSVDHDVHTTITNAAGDPIATVTVRWRLGPV